MLPNLSPKIGTGLLGMPVLRPRVVLMRDKAERWKSFSWAFVIVEERNEGQFLLAAAGRTKAVMW